MAKQENDECFVIMPISDPENYEPGHFARVYEDIICPACQRAELTPKRADEPNDTGSIHLDILRSLLDAPMAICDLSTRNPNVLYELGLRHAFDKPVVLIQEEDTPRIFDVSTLLRTLDYRKAPGYQTTLEDQKKICEALLETKDTRQRGTGINSIVRLLELVAPALNDSDGPPRPDQINKLIWAELTALREEIQGLNYGVPRTEISEGYKLKPPYEDNGLWPRTKFPRTPQLSQPHLFPSSSIDTGEPEEET